MCKDKEEVKEESMEVEVDPHGMDEEESESESIVKDEPGEKETDEPVRGSGSEGATDPEKQERKEKRKLESAFSGTPVTGSSGGASLVDRKEALNLAKANVEGGGNSDMVVPQATCRLAKDCVLPDFKVVGRPARSHGASMGDHTTPFSIVQRMALDAFLPDEVADEANTAKTRLKFVTVVEARDGLKALYEATRTLPGYGCKWIDERQARWKKHEDTLTRLMKDVDTAATCECKISIMQHAIAEYLEYREMIPLSTMNTRAITSSGGKGKGESVFLAEYENTGKEECPAAYAWFDYAAVAIWESQPDVARKHMVAPWVKCDDTEITRDMFLQQHCEALPAEYKLTPENMEKRFDEELRKATRSEIAYLLDDMVAAQAEEGAYSRSETEADQFRSSRKALGKYQSARDYLQHAQPVVEAMLAKDVEPLLPPEALTKGAASLTVGSRGDAVRDRLGGSAKQAEADETQRRKDARQAEEDRIQYGADKVLTPRQRQNRTEKAVQRGRNRTAREQHAKDRLQQFKTDLPILLASAVALCDKRILELTTRVNDMVEASGASALGDEGSGEEPDEADDETGDETSTAVVSDAEGPVRVQKRRGTVCVQVVGSDLFHDAVTGLAVQVATGTDCMKVSDVFYAGRAISPFNGSMGSHQIAWAVLCDFVEAQVKGKVLGSKKMCAAVQALAKEPKKFREEFAGSTSDVNGVPRRARLAALRDTMKNLLGDPAEGGAAKKGPGQTVQPQSESLMDTNDALLKRLAEANTSCSTLEGLQAYLYCVLTAINLVPGVTIQTALPAGSAEGKHRTTVVQGTASPGAIYEAFTGLIDEKGSLDSRYEVRQHYLNVLERTYPSYSQCAEDLQEWAAPPEDIEVEGE